MQPSEIDAFVKNLDGEGDGSQQPERAAQFVSTVVRLTSFLDSCLANGVSRDDALRTWCQWERNSLVRRYGFLVYAQLAWWHYVLNPVWAFLFTLKRRLAVKNPARVQKEEWELLDYYLGRAEFVFSLSANSREFMRRKISDGVISRRQAMAIMRSFGCSISKSGSISASPIGVVGLIVGKVVMSVFVIMFMLLVGELMAELQGSCVRLCVVVGSIQLMIVSIYFTSVALALSTGRNRVALKLDGLLSSQEKLNN